MIDDPTNLNNFAAISKALRKDSRSIHNRLCSIDYDSQFVLEVGSAFGLPLVGKKDFM